MITAERKPFDFHIRLERDEYADYWTHHRERAELPPAVIDSLVAHDWGAVQPGAKASASSL